MVDTPRIFTAGDPEPNVGPGTVAAVHYGDYRRQELWIRSGANIGAWYPLGGEFGAPKVAEDPRPDETFSRDRWQRPPGTVPLHPSWYDMVERGPVTILVAAPADAYTAGWRTGRARLLEQIDQLRDDEYDPQ
jgi:hypothetical protein